jgi:hypothetical protein
MCALAQEPARWLAHDMQRPRPPMVKVAPQHSTPAPSDAIVLYDGGDLSKWRGEDGSPAKWVARDGYMESVPGSGYVFTADKFGDVQLHVEWVAPVPAKGHGQGRGNSGVFLMGLYEVQVLDSFDNVTYADGQAAAVYGQYPPLVNASLPPGELQVYEIVFRRPRFQADGTVETPARMTVFHNGVLVQDNVELWGPTAWLQNKPYAAHAEKLPLSLQDHGNPVRFKNIWLRELPETAPAGPTEKPKPAIELPVDALKKFAGAYGSLLGKFGQIKLDADRKQLVLHMETGQVIELVPQSPTDFGMRYTAGRLLFDVEGEAVKGFTFELGGERYPIKRQGE